MIRIHGPQSFPSILRSRGVPLRDSMCDQFDRGDRNFRFEPKIYGAKSVKRSLAIAQHNKCCYCESKFLHSSYGDIDHFRPKAGVRQSFDEPERQPGYYWLAYELDNLLFCCEVCNRGYKRTFFPLSLPMRRARNHTADISLESPLIINPRTQSPDQYIAFRGEYPHAINGTDRGKATIKFLGLDREALNEARREHLVKVDALWRLSRMNPNVVPESAEASSHLLRLGSDMAPFASATRYFLKVLNS